MLPGAEDAGDETGVDPAALFELTETGGDGGAVANEFEEVRPDKGVEVTREVGAGLDGAATADDVDSAGAAVELTGPGETGQTVV